MPEQNVPHIKGEGQYIDHPDGRRDVVVKVKVVDLISAVGKDPEKRDFIKHKFNLSDKQIDDVLEKQQTNIGG